jgi:hypothetical protein
MTPGPSDWRERGALIVSTVINHPHAPQAARGLDKPLLIATCQFLLIDGLIITISAVIPSSRLSSLVYCTE